MSKLTDLYEEIRDTFTGPKTRTWAENAKEVYSSLMVGLKGYSGDALGKTAQSFNDAIPYIERAGYDVTEIEVGVGLSPRIVPHLRLREILDDDVRRDLLREVRGKRMVYTILSSLFKATATRKRLKFNQFHFSDIEMELSLLPTVVLKFKPNTGARQTDRPDELIKEAKNLGLIPEPEEDAKPAPKKKTGK